MECFNVYEASPGYVAWTSFSFRLISKLLYRRESLGTNVTFKRLESVRFCPARGHSQVMLQKVLSREKLGCMLRKPLHKEQLKVSIRPNKIEEFPPHLVLLIDLFQDLVQ